MDRRNWRQNYKSTFGNIGNIEHKPERVNFNRLEFAYFIAHSNGVIIGCANDEDGNEFTYAIAKDGSVRYKKNQGIWKELSIIDAASIRYFAGKVYNRSVPTFQTRQQLTY